ncbi:hypothetical protein [Tenacibaculum geojense]|uniref:Lipoprotein n=1 Tax=Tenacibaculum geojense TaxID=915352 RepID=A0ABW3JRG0_9FLAO
MNKILLLLLSITMLIGCKTETKSDKNETAETEQTLPQFKSVREMLADASDYYEENGSLKFISEDKSKLHIQVSKPILEADLENVKEEIVKRDIVYVAFQTFAQTDIDKLIITAVPNDMENRKKYYEKYKKTVSVDRKNAQAVLKKYLDSEDFSILYKLDGTLWLPNDNFSKLKFEKLNQVYADLSK